MLHKVLQRIEQNDFASYGTLDSFVTLEKAWVNNDPNLSCIPAGLWVFTRTYSPHLGYDTWDCEEVPGRKYIRLHILNLPSQSDGCIGIGTMRGIVHLTDDSLGLPGILGSTNAFHLFMRQTIGEDTLQLDIRNPPS